MDKTENDIVSLTETLMSYQFEQRTWNAARLRLLDSVGCALAATRTPPVAALRKMAPRVGQDGVRIWGTDTKTTVDHAAILNSAMVRYLDMNDAYFMTSTAHPSDNIGALIALCDFTGGTVSDALRAVIISYEVQCRFCDVAPFHQNGWDQSIAGAPGAAMGAAAILGLDKETTRHALALSITPNLPTYRTRLGTLSMWKGLAGPYGARAGIQAAQMAAHGITGPEASFDGPKGLWAQTLGEPLRLPFPLTLNGHVFAIEQSDLKLFPVRIACQLPTLLALELKEQINGEDIANVTVVTDTHSFGAQSKDPALWYPETRESADHSLPFCLAVALLDGAVTIDTFEKQRFLDAHVRDLMAKTDIVFDADFNATAPATRACRLIVDLQDGQRLEIERRLPPGDPKRIPEPQRIASKVHELICRDFTPAHAEKIIAELRIIELQNPSQSISKAMITG